MLGEYVQGVYDGGICPMVYCRWNMSKGYNYVEEYIQGICAVENVLQSHRISKTVLMKRFLRCHFFRL